MNISAFTPSARQPRVAVLLAVPILATAVLLTSCEAGGSTIAQGSAVTPTATPTGTSSSARAAAAAKSAQKAGAPRSDVVGRQFDLGTIVRVVQEGRVPVIIFDRWTVKGVADSKVAANGTPIAVHSDVPYQNLNSGRTFRIPVVDGAIFTYSHCVAVDQPAQQRSSTLREFARLQGSEAIMLLTLDPRGQVYKAQNDPAC